MAQTKVDLNESAPDLLVRNHKGSKEDSSTSFVTSEADAGSLSAFLEAHRGELSNGVDASRPFFSINGSTIYGKKNERVIGGVVPLFDGVALDLETALLHGTKRWFRDPEAKGEGGLVTILPQNIDTAILLQMDKVHLKPDHVEAHATSLGGTGFGKYNKVEPKELTITNDQVTFSDVTLNAWQKKASTKEAKSKVIPSMTLAQEGLMAPQVPSDVLYDFINFEPQDIHSQITNVSIIGRKDGAVYQKGLTLNVLERGDKLRLFVEGNDTVTELEDAFWGENESYCAKSLKLEGLVLDGVVKEGLKGKILSKFAAKAKEKNLDTENHYQNLTLEGKNLMVDDVSQQFTWEKEAEDEESGQDVIDGLLEDGESVDLDVEGMISAIAQGVSDAVNSLENAISQMGSDIADAMELIKKGITTIPQEILKNLNALMKYISDGIATIAKSITDLAQSFRDKFMALMNGFANIPEALMKKLEEAIASAKKAVDKLMGKLTGLLANVKDSLRKLINDIANLPADLLKGITDAINGMIAGLNTMGEKLLLMAENFANTLVSIGECIANIPEDLMKALEAAFETMATNFLSIATGIAEIVSSLLEKIGKGLDLIAGLPGLIADNVKEAIDATLRSIAEMVEKLQSVLDGIANSIVYVIKSIANIPDSIKEMFQEALRYAKNSIGAMIGKLNDIAQKVKDGITSMVDGVLSIPKNIMDEVSDLIESAKDGMKQVVDYFASSLANIRTAIFELAKTATDAALATLGMLSNALETMGDNIAYLAKEMVSCANAFVDGVKSVPGAIADFAKTSYDSAKTTLLTAAFDYAEENQMTPEAIKNNLNAALSMQTSVDASSTVSDEEENGIAGSAGVEVSIPIVPLVKFQIGAGASYGIKYTLDKDITDFSAGTDKKENEGKTMEATGMVGVTVTGAAAVYALIGVLLGVDHVLNVTGQLKASLDMKADLKARAEAKIAIIRGAPRIQRLDLKGSIDAALIAKAAGAIVANFFIWSKDLVSITFAEKSLGTLTGDLKLSRDFAGNKKWIADKSMNFKTLAGKGKKVISSEDTLKELLSKSSKREDLFQVTQTSFEALKNDFIQARELVQAYQDGDEKNPVVVDTNKENGGPAMLAAKAVHLSNAFQLQYERSKDAIDQCLIGLKEEANNPALHSAMVSKSEVEKLQKELAEIQKLLNSEDESKVELGTANLENFTKRVKSSDYTVNHFGDSLKDEAKSTLQTVAHYRTYEENRILELQKPFVDRRGEAINYGKEKLGLKFYDKSAELAKYYGGKRGNLLDEHYSNIMGKDKVLEFLGTKTEKAREENKKDIAGHQDRLAALTPLYEKIAEDARDKPNYEFFRSYAGDKAKEVIGEKATSLVKHPVFQSSNKTMLTDFILEYSKAKDGERIGYLATADSIMRTNSSLEALKAKGISSNEDRHSHFKLSEKLGGALAEHREAILEDRHKSATEEDFILARKRIKAQAQLIANRTAGEKEKFEQTIVTTDGKKTVKTDKYNNGLREQLLDRQDALDVLILFERQFKGDDKSKFLESLQKAKAAYEDTTSTVPPKQLLMDRNKQIEEYLAYKKSFTLNDTRLEMMEKAMRLDYRTDLFIADSELESYDGASSTLPLYQKMHKYGIKKGSSNDVDASKNHQVVAQIIKARKGDTVDAEDVAQYHRYMAHENGLFNSNHSPLMELYTLQQTADEGTLMKKIDENDDIKKAYLKFLKENAGRYISPQTIMNYEMGRLAFYHDPHSADIASITTGGEDALTSFAGTDLGKEFHKKTKDQGISREDIFNMEQAAMAAATAKHTDRLDALMKLDPNASTKDLEGQGNDISRWIISDRVDEITQSPKEYASFTTDYLAKESAIHKDVLDKVAEGRDAASTQIKTLQDQMEVCRTIADHANAALTNPMSIINDFGNFDTNVLKALESESQKADATSSSSTQTESTLQKLTDTSKKLTENLMALQKKEEGVPV